MELNMAKARKLDNNTTKMKVFWLDKDLMSCFKKKVNGAQGNNGRVRYESDGQVFKRILIFFAEHNKAVNPVPKSTYPSLKDTLLAG